MGGGDLNMKKHFHPLTQENLERVWKAEEKKKREEERISQLQQEIAQERQKEAFEQQAIESGIKKKKKERLDWMYSGQQAVDKEAYLLGKKIDKNVAVAKEEEQGLASGAVTSSSSSSTSGGGASKFKANDVLAKIKEDPLFLIKKKEDENRKMLMANTIKVRKMKELIQERTNDRSGEKKHKKKSKSKKRRRETSSSEDSSSDDDDDERESYRRKRKSSDSNSSSSSRYQKESRFNGRHQRQDDYIRNDRVEARDDSSSEDEELKAQREAMMSNAKWRQSEREKNTSKYRKEKEKEEKDVDSMLKKTSKAEEKAQFVRKMQKDNFSATDTSVEDRIRRNIHSKQRTTAALDKAFTKR